MPWMELSIMEIKRNFVQEALKPGGNFSLLCQSYGISRKCGYATLKRYRDSGEQGLSHKSRKPKRSPHETSVEIVKQILEVRKDNPKWGARKIREYLFRQGLSEMPSEKTLTRILNRYGCINPEESAKHKPYIRFEHAHPNDLWQMDFKGYFKVGEKDCHPLTLLDDHSRYSLAIVSCANEQKETVIQALIKVFREYGLPKRMTMDNGSPWGYASDQRYTAIDLWLIRLGIRVSHSRPYHPQTQGKLERFHRTMKLELLSDYYFDNVEHAQEGFDWWRKKYNEERPHEAIGLAVPQDRYHKSDRAYPEKLPDIEYDSHMDVRKVSIGATIHYKGSSYKIGKGLIGQYIGLKEQDNNEHMLDVYYGQQKVLELQKT